MIIKFEMQVWCGDDEPHRFVYRYRGEILGWDNDDDDDYREPHVKIGEIHLFYCDRVRTINEGESFYEEVSRQDFGEIVDSLKKRDNCRIVSALRNKFFDDALYLPLPNAWIRMLGHHGPVRTVPLLATSRVRSSGVKRFGVDLSR